MRVPLAEDGKLSVRDPVAKWYPDLTKAKEITLYDLMSHASGYPDYYPLDFVDRRMMKAIEPGPVAQGVRRRRSSTSSRAAWSYSNTGFVLLGRIIEKVSGKPLRRFLDRANPRPLRMDDTVLRPESRAQGAGDRGTPASHSAPPEPAAREAPGWIHAAGALVHDAVRPGEMGRGPRFRGC